MQESAQSPEVTLVGLGLMGTAMASRLLAAGWKVQVWNRTPGKAASLLARGALWTDRPFGSAGRVILSLFDTVAVREVVGRMLPDARPGLIVMDTTTGDPAEVLGVARALADAGVRYVDAPISGSSDQTLRGEALVMVGGAHDDFAACSDLWAALGGRAVHCGPVGSASRMKLVTNLVLGLNRAALAEGLAFAESQGVDPAAALAVLRESMAYSRAVDAKGIKMVRRDFAPQARLSQHLKDVRILLGLARDAGQELPLSEVHRALMERGEAMGLGDLDNSAVLEVLRPHGRSPGTGSVQPGGAS
ncbi:MAG: NAD(P)-dependent oxidoreductase [Verrucomicrobiota bacterium]|jgi:3-hydroxyisobutyrate dehydrogenase-like beta-hydroxyacid dehydrogenase